MNDRRAMNKLGVRAAPLKRTAIKTILRMTAVALGLLALTSSASIIDIYYESFSGFTASLNDWPADIAPDGERWVTRTTGSFFQRAGTISGNGSSNASLPFTPQQGNIYRLSVEMNVTNTDGWIAAGFSEKRTQGAHAHSWSDVNGYAWAYLPGTRQDPVTVTGVAANGLTAPFSAMDVSDFITVRITLDTTDTDSSLWTAAWEVSDKNGLTQTAGPTVAHTGNYDEIRYVGISHANGAQGAVDNFRLQIIPEPGTLSIMGLGAAALLLRRRFARVV